MEFLLAILLLTAAFYVGWNIGANDAANCIGTTVGASVLPYRSAALMMAVFVILGGVLQGHHVMKTVGKGIVITETAVYESQNDEAAPPQLKAYFPDQRLPDLAILVALLSAGFFVTLATFSSVPVSTSQAIVGGVAGTGLGIVGLQASYFKLGVLLKILGAWVISPVLALILAFIVYSFLNVILRRARAIIWSNLLRIAVIASAAYVSYSLGANDVGNAIGPLLNKYPDKGIHLAVLGGVAMAIGALTFGKRVTTTVGRSITPLDYSGALAAQSAAAFGVHMFSMLGIPVSTSQAVVGAIIGVGLTKGARAVSKKKITTIFAGWIVTPLCAAIFAALVYRLLYSLLY
ncbi:MAG: inorganic phosphate transporter family protein [Gammaproteobacteria bacterium]|nr:inorganic phosphate transporter family protein [Gammaproteobacteria bacterium]NNC57792.1 inorganic phosphate transporter [Woeseiaceae bacterium]NNL50778.1 inorganic phosphate transporter [Woeseiaceae bacterium]